MGARLLAHALAAEEEPLRSVRVTSAGVSAFAGDPAAENSVKALKKVGLDLRDHRSRCLSEHMVNQALAVIVMTDEHRSLIHARMPELAVPVMLYREHLPEDACRQVPDPYGQSIEAYLETRDALAEAVPSLVAWLRKELEKQTRH